MRLSEVKEKGKVKIIKINKKAGAIKRRLADMGVVKNEQVEIKRIAPLGDPIEISVKGYKLCLRKEEAKNIEVEKL